MNPETLKYLKRVIDRQKEISEGPPFEVRDKLRAFTKELEKVIEGSLKAKE